MMQQTDKSQTAEQARRGFFETGLPEMPSFTGSVRRISFRTGRPKEVSATCNGAARCFQTGDFRLVVSMIPSRDRSKCQTAQRLRLEVWQPLGPRVLEIEWQASKSQVVQLREGDWVRRLIQASQALFSQGARCREAGTAARQG